MNWPRSGLTETFEIENIGTDWGEKKMWKTLGKTNQYLFVTNQQLGGRAGAPVGLSAQPRGAAVQHPGQHPRRPAWARPGRRAAVGPLPAGRSRGPEARLRCGDLGREHPSTWGNHLSSPFHKVHEALAFK